jgi:hypothetical protein
MFEERDDGDAVTRDKLSFFGFLDALFPPAV